MAGSAPGFNPGAQDYYNQQLGLNLSNYNQIGAAYNQAQSNAASQLSGIYAGYGALSKSVLGALGVTGGGWGIAQPAADTIARQSTQVQGQNQQSLINAGLGNSSLLANVRNQNQLQTNQAYGALGAQLAQTGAGYMSQIGLAGLGAQQQGLGLQSQLSQSYMGDISHYNFAPNVPLYGQYSNSGGGGGGGYGGGGGTQGSAAPGGAAGAIAGAGGMPFGSAGGGNSYGYSGAYGGGYSGVASNIGPSFTGYPPKPGDADYNATESDSTNYLGEYVEES